MNHLISPVPLFSTGLGGRPSISAPKGVLPRPKMGSYVSKSLDLSRVRVVFPPVGFCQIPDILTEVYGYFSLKELARLRVLNKESNAVIKSRVFMEYHFKRYELRTPPMEDYHFNRIWITNETQLEELQQLDDSRLSLIHTLRLNEFQNFSRNEQRLKLYELLRKQGLSRLKCLGLNCCRIETLGSNDILKVFDNLQTLSVLILSNVFSCYENFFPKSAWEKLPYLTTLVLDYIKMSSVALEFLTEIPVEEVRLTTNTKMMMCCLKKVNRNRGIKRLWIRTGGGPGRESSRFPINNLVPILSQYLVEIHFHTCIFSNVDSFLLKLDKSSINASLERVFFRNCWLGFRVPRKVRFEAVFE